MKGIIAAGIGVLGLGALLLANAGRSAASSPAAAGLPTLINCGEGRQALVTNETSGTARVECVPVHSAGFAAGAQFASLGASAPVVAAALAPSAVVQERVVYRDRPVSRTTAPQSSVSTAKASSSPTSTSNETRTARTRSWQRSAVIIGGSTAAGAGVGAVLDGKDGAKKGAVVGLLGGTVYDIATRNKH